MITRSFITCACVLATLHLSSAAPVTYADGKLDNGIVTVAFEAQGFFTIQDAKTGDVLLSNARFALPWGRTGNVESITVADLTDELGTGKRVTLSVVDSNELRYHRALKQLFTYALYENHPALVCGFGLETPNFLSLRVRESRPLGGGQFFGGRTIEKPMTLNGGAGDATTTVEPGLTRSAANALMLTGTVEGTRRSVVWGGLRYREFGAYATLQNGSPAFYSEDPIGRLIDEDQTWLAHDTLYIDVHTRDPFEALERYGIAMRAANHASPNIYDFPVLCGWSVGALSKLPNVNNSAKLIDELNHANNSGITKYTPVSLRLEPDKYHFDTEQGWWDDERFRLHKHLVEPYDTMAKWCTAMRAGGGIPYTYMQLGMPSDDFARQFPQWMLFNDSSEVDKFTPGKILKNYKGPGKNLKPRHPHHQPYVTYDYTDKEFQAHFLKVWKKIAADGVRGVKVDYPDTSWRPEGGFDDRYSTTNAAYRIPYQLLREAFGKDGFIDERNLDGAGESTRPCLEVTAGIVDTQRTWTDSKDYEPAMISISGLRWYKNRSVFQYYPDTKAVHGISPGIRQSMLTMVFLTSGRLDLATSFSFFTPEITRDVSRTYPHYSEPKSARPLDAFTGVKDPQVYDLELTPDWHQITFYNTGKERAAISTAMSGQCVDNAIGLDPSAEYHAYDFWSDTYLGKISGKARLEREIEPNHCAMISVRKAQAHPQVVSTDRHILQGWVDLTDIRWDSASKTLSGTAHVIGGDPFKISIAHNGAKPLEAQATGGDAKLEAQAAPGLGALVLTAKQNTDIKWTLRYE
jgi:hypothetical protein